MLPGRCTRGLCLISFLLISCAVILDDTAILFAGGALAAGILGQYLLFDASVRDIIASVDIRRSLSRNPVRKGTVLHVSTTVTARGATGMQVQIADLPPTHSLPVDGVTTATLKADPTPQVHQIRYQILPDISGTQHFSGVRVTVRNLFFEDTITLARERDCGPALLVQPSGFFEAPASELSEGSLYSRKLSVWRGVEFHSLREYHPGDDIRRVDWKVSAKFGKIFIKQYHEETNYPPFLIVDLPWGSLPFSKREFDQLVYEVTGRIQHTIETYQFVSVLLISGPNILHLIREEQNLSRCISELREWLHPTERMVHFYHMKDRSDLRSLVKECEQARMQAADPGLQAFYETLRDRYLSVLQYEQTPAFTGQVRKILSQIVVSNAYILSLGYGDTSHIWLLAQMLQSQNVRVHVRIMDVQEAHV